jgi:rhodanese-related sulfurtransferase
MTGSERREAKDALFDGFASVAKALASGRRAEIIELLAQGERTVDGIARELDQSLANTSHHLRTLARAGLLAGRRAGTHVHYRLASDDVLELWWAMRKVAVDQLDEIDQLAHGYLGDRDQIETLTRDELLARLDRGEVVVVDVRPHAEYAAGHLPGAVHVPPDQLELLDELPDGQEVVAYCRGPYCVYADDAVRRLRQQGRQALRLEDGLPEWRQAGGPVEV